jgi:hypothetical protein
MRRRAATAMPIAMPALAPVDIPEDALLTRFDMGKAFVGAIKRRARKGDVMPSIEDMLSGLVLVFFDLRSTRRVELEIARGLQA